MPPVNHAVLASAGIIVASVAVAAAIAIYESPEIRRAAEDLRRRIAIALHNLGDNLDPGRQDPIFNRPEDAEGFLQSRSSLGADQGVDADDETRRRQREELMYWNAQLEAKKQEQRASQRVPRRTSSRGSNFDDFLQEDKTAERGTFVFNTGADLSGAHRGDQQLLKRRGFVDGVRGLNASMIANPFSDEYGIELDEHHREDREAEEESKRLLSPEKDEAMSDIYNATPRDGRSVVSDNFPQSKPVVPEVLFDFDSQARSQSGTMEDESRRSSTTDRSATLERELDENEFMTAGQEDRAEAYASIQAWAQGSSSGFYSPLPVSPPAPLSEPEVISTGELTPTDSVSLAGSGEDVGNDVASSKNGDYDVMSEDSDDGMATPNSWSEVGSMISESDSAVHA